MSTNNSIKHGPRFIDLTGQTFGKWTILGPHSIDKHGRYMWLCRCECGVEKHVNGTDLRIGKSSSCHRCTKKHVHGGSGTPVFNVWRAMRDRCRNPHNPAYHRYLGRGIAVCDRWHDFANFRDDMGPRPSSSHSIERIDNDGDYCPENCYWATWKEQANNRVTNRMLTHGGKTLHLSEWAEEIGIGYGTLTSRLSLGWSPERALTTPLARAKEITFRGETKTISGWAEETGISRDTIAQRLKLGWSTERTLTAPSRVCKRKAR